MSIESFEQIHTRWAIERRRQLDELGELPAKAGAAVEELAPAFGPHPYHDRIGARGLCLTCGLGKGSHS